MGKAGSIIPGVDSPVRTEGVVSGTDSESEAEVSQRMAKTRKTV